MKIGFSTNVQSNNTNRADVNFKKGIKYMGVPKPAQEKFIQSNILPLLGEKNVSALERFGEVIIKFPADVRDMLSLCFRIKTGNSLKYPVIKNYNLKSDSYERAMSKTADFIDETKYLFS